MKNLIGLIVLVICGALAACSPQQSTNANEGAAQKALLANTVGNIVTDKKRLKSLPNMEGNTRLYITLSCQRGNLPEKSSPIKPVDAYYSILDDKYLGKEMTAFLNDDDYEQHRGGQTGEDGIANFNFDEERSYKIQVWLANPDDYHGRKNNISNYEYETVMLKKGATIHKNFVLSQAICDKNRGITDIDMRTFHTEPLAFSAAYDDTYMDPQNPLIQQYYRARHSGDFEYFENIRAGLNGRKSGLYLKEGIAKITLINVQTETKTVTKCGTKTSSQLVVKRDAALGVETYFGKVGGNIVNCRTAFITHFPIVKKRVGDGKLKHIRAEARNYPTYGEEIYRSSCNADGQKSIKVDESGGMCKTVSETFTTFVTVGAPNTAWGNHESYTGSRYDSTTPETEPGKVPKTFDP